MLRQKLPVPHARRRRTVGCGPGHSRVGTCPTRQSGTGRRWWCSPTAGFQIVENLPRLPYCKTSAGTNNGNATDAQWSINVITALPSTSRYEKHPASSAQLGPPSSVEADRGPGLARQVAVKRGRRGPRLPNNPRRGASRVTLKITHLQRSPRQLHRQLGEFAVIDRLVRGADPARHGTARARRRCPR